MAEGELQGEWAVPAPEFTAAPPEVAAGLAVRRPLPTQQLPTEDGALSLPLRTVAQPLLLRP